LLRKYKIAPFISVGTLFYIEYTFILYTFAVHFNGLFLVYCAIFGLTTYALVLSFTSADFTEHREYLLGRINIKFYSGFFIVLALMFYFLWLSEDIPAIINGVIPKSVIDSGLLTNPVHVLDISILLPGMILVSINLIRRRTIGHFFIPIFLVFTIIMAINIAGLILSTKMQGFPAELDIAAIMALLAIIAIVLLINIFRRR
jgi:hypothetical protein